MLKASACPSVGTSPGDVSDWTSHCIRLHEAELGSVNKTPCYHSDVGCVPTENHLPGVHKKPVNETACVPDNPLTINEAKLRAGAAGETSAKPYLGVNNNTADATEDEGGEVAAFDPIDPTPHRRHDDYPVVNIPGCLKAKLPVK